MASRESLPRGVLLTLDVSATACGWAAFGPDDTLRAFGVIRPRKAALPTARIDEIVRRVRGLVEAHRPAAVLMEFSDGHCYRKVAEDRAMRGLSVLGAAQGAVRQMLREAMGASAVATVGDTVWTLAVPKKERAARVAMEFPDYAAFRRSGQDEGLDAADAIGIGLYHFARAHEARLIERTRIRGGRV